jgi:RNA polymerase sigma factor (sigma-70 family)
MDETAIGVRMAQDQDRRITEVVARDGSRLRSFIRRRVPDPSDAEDVLQEVLYELVRANRLLMPIEHVTGWLFRVARNRITDLFRRRKPERIDDDELGIATLLESPEAGPEAAYARRALLEELARAIEELPKAQRDVFVAHELEGVGFAEMSRATGINVNTLLARKRYAVRRLRERLRGVRTPGKEER